MMRSASTVSTAARRKAAAATWKMRGHGATAIGTMITIMTMIAAKIR